jgi:hypothetical protein
MILVAALHTLGNLSTAPIDDRQAPVEQAMCGYIIPLGLGMVPSWEIFRLLTLILRQCSGER